MDTSKRILTFDEAVEFTGYKKSYLYKLTSTGIIPHSKPNGKRIFFDREKLEDWLLGNSRTGQEERKQQAATYLTTNHKKSPKSWN